MPRVRLFSARLREQVAGLHVAGPAPGQRWSGYSDLAFDLAVHGTGLSHARGVRGEDALRSAQLRPCTSHKSTQFCMEFVYRHSIGTSKRHIDNP